MSTNDNDHEEGWEVPISPLTLLPLAKKSNQLVAHGDGSYCVPYYSHLLMLLKREGKKERKGKEKGGEGGACDKNMSPPLLILCFSQL
jgi:hypothetical protein